MSTRRRHVACTLLLTLSALAANRAHAGLIAGGDTFEPDSCASARPLASGSPVGGFLNPSTDRDYYTLSAACGDLLRVEVVPMRQDVAVLAIVYGPAPGCAAIAGSVQGIFGTPFDGMPMAMTRQITTAGTYTIEVRTGLNVLTTEGAYVGPYTLTATTSPGPCAAPTEPSDLDACASAMVLGDGSIVRRAISPAGDRDFYAIPTSCGDNLFVSVTPTSGTWAARMDRHSIGDTACAFSPTFLGSTLPGATLTYVSPNATGAGDGVFRFRVSSNTPGGTGSYTIAVMRSASDSCSPDAFDPADDARAACRPLPAAPEPHAMAPSTDQDWSCASLLRGQRLTLGLEVAQRVGRRSSTQLTAFDAGGAYLDSDRTSGIGALSRLRFAAPEDGDYAFRVTSGNATAVGHYDLMVRSIEDGPSIHATSIQSTSPVGTLVTATPGITASDYSMSVGSAALIDISATGTDLGLANERFALLDLPFEFEYYGSTYSQVSVGDNGFLTFERLAGTVASTNPCPHPSTGAVDPKTSIAPFWDSLDPSVAGAGVHAQVLGLAPDRLFVVQWTRVALSPGGGSHTFQVLLHEATRAVELRYGPMVGAPASSGSSATIGIQDETGARGVTHSCNTAGGAVEGRSLTFQPPSGVVPFPVGDAYLVAKDAAPLEDISSFGTRLTLTDNGSATVPLPFTFLHYGVPKSSVIVSANGLLRFAAASDLNRDCPLPMTGGARSLIAPLWEDWNPAVAGSVYWASDGPPGARRFIAMWKDVPHARPAGSLVPGGAHTFEAILTEGTNVIELRYGALGGAPESDGSGATIGLESDDERKGVAVSCNSAQQVGEGDRWTFTPTLRLPTFEWREPGSGALLSTASSLFMPAEGRCDVRLIARGEDPEALSMLEDEELVLVPDVAPPVVTGSDDVLHCVWPPNRAAVTFRLADFSPGITDNCSDFDWRIASCVDERGAASPDCVVAADGRSLTLRATRPGQAREGLRHAVRVVATDAAGNASAEQRIGWLLVPHDQRLARGCVRARPSLR